LVGLTLDAVDTRNNTLIVRQGKGNKDRYLPLGKRAADWLARYLLDVRPQLLLDVHEAHVFLTNYGAPFERTYLGNLVKQYLRRAGLTLTGSCHVFRHAMATHMLENGADIRFIQAMLGHADLTSTQIYTHVSIRKLQEIHAATHPAKLESKDILLAQLQLESEEDADN
jgi:integrase/recombinase XerD